MMKLQSKQNGSAHAHSSARVRSRASRAPAVVVRATSSTASDKAQPAWTGDGMLSKVVNWMISTKPVFNVMKLGAKNAMKSTTLKAGIDWDGHVRKMQQTAEASAGPSDHATSKLSAHAAPVIHQYLRTAYTSVLR
eukprot:GHRQ01029759.1.p1 GENE.GHRQ01029759.1~~GHRQ01029759.1.p1  ORF type:complete len:136 (+),score=25.94 GHRQ01029759.1:815-1222(+)